MFNTTCSADILVDLLEVVGVDPVAAEPGLEGGSVGGRGHGVTAQDPRGVWVQSMIKDK